MERCGSAVAVGDLNGDGFAELLASAPQAGNGGRTASGSVYAVSGATSLPSGNVDLQLAASFQFRLDGSFANGGLGRSLSTGDLDGDGFDELVVGEPGAGNNARTNAGSVFVVRGIAALPSGVVDLGTASNSRFRIDGALAGDRLGTSSATGDLNGDGYDDVLAGAPPAGNNGRAGSGSVFAFAGAASLPTGTVDATTAAFRVDGASAGDAIGTSLATGDLDGDGFSELLVGALQAPTGRAGAGSVSALSGNSILPTGSVDLRDGSAAALRVDGASAGDGFGATIAAGDFNGDGFDDLFATAAGTDANARPDSGSAYIIVSTTAGDPGPLTLQSPAGNAPPRRVPSARLTLDFTAGTAGVVTVQRIPQRPSSGFGATMARVVWIVTTTKTGVTGTVATFKYTNADIQGLAEANLRLYSRPTEGGPSEWVPVSNAVLNTANNTVTATVDGFSQFSLNAATNPTWRGQVRNVGTPSAFNMRFDGPDSSSQVGIVATGDLNGDGFTDFAISTSLSGIVYVVLGTSSQATGQVRYLADPSSYRFRILQAAASDALGSSIAMGDLNGDGFDELIVSSRQADPNGRTSAGTVYVFAGSATTPMGTVNLAMPAGAALVRATFAGPVDFAALGSSMAVGDLNGDGLADLIFSAPAATLNGVTQAGALYCVPGTATLPSGSFDLATASSYRFRVDGPTASVNFGWSIAVSDLNGDGFDDLVASAPFTSPGGSVYVLTGGATLPTGVLATSTPTSYRFRIDGISGTSIGLRLTAGDLDGDGFADVVLGSQNKVFGVTGQATLPTGTVSLGTAGAFRFQLDGASGETLGDSITVADLNADGRGDLLIGSGSSSFNGVPASGSVYAVYGASPLPSGAAQVSTLFDLRVDGAAMNDFLAGSLAADVDGDGFEDLFCAAPNTDFNFWSNAGSVYLQNVVTGGLPPPQTVVLPAGNAPRRVLKTARIALDFSAGSAGTVTVQRTPRKPTTVRRLASRTANVSWRLSGTRAASSGPVVTFKYTNDDVQGLSEASLRLYTRPAGGSASSWRPVFPEAVVDPMTNTITATLTRFGEFTVRDQ